MICRYAGSAYNKNISVYHPAVVVQQLENRCGHQWFLMVRGAVVPHFFLKVLPDQLDKALLDMGHFILCNYFGEKIVLLGDAHVSEHSI